MKTVLVTLPLRRAIVDQLFSGILTTLAERDGIRVVVAVPEIPGLERLTSRRDLGLEFVTLPEFGRFALTRAIYTSLNFRFPKVRNIRSKEIQLRRIRARHPGRYWRRVWLSQPLPGSRLIFAGLNGVMHRLPNVSERVARLIDEIEPDLVYSTVLDHLYEYQMIKRAKRLGIPTAGMVYSWDRLVLHGYMPEILDHYAVWNRDMGAELIGLYGIDPARVALTGMARWDVFHDRSNVESRERYFHRMGLDPARKTILFPTGPSWTEAHELDIMQDLARSLIEPSGGMLQMLVRIHPQDDPAKYSGLISDQVKLDHPIDGFELITKGDGSVDIMQHKLDFMHQARDTLLHSDVIISSATTFAVEAAILDRPVINIAYDARGRDFWLSDMSYYLSDHYRRFTGTGAIKMAESFDQLSTLVHRYLEDPSLEQAERALAARKVAHRVDGSSTRRTVGFLEAILAAGRGTLGAEQLDQAGVPDLEFMSDPAS